MALRAEEVLRIKWECGVSVTLLGAEPFIAYLAVFDRAIQPYIIDPSTTSSTVVAAAASGATVQVTCAAIPVIAGTSTPAFTVGTTVSVDVGPNNEKTQILAVSGNAIWVTLSNAHGGASGAYPISMAGGETVVRDILTRLDTIKAELENVAPKTAGMEQVDEVKMYASSRPGSARATYDKFESLLAQREQARNDLAEAIGFTNLRNLKRGGGGRVEVY